jgi:hypothetical protein
MSKCSAVSHQRDAAKVLRMKHGVQEKLELFARNVLEAEKGLKRFLPVAKRLAAFVYTLNGKQIDCKAVMNSLAEIKDTTNWASEHWYASLCLAPMMSLRTEQRKLIARSVKVHDAIYFKKEPHFAQSDILAMAAYTIVANVERERYPEMVSRVASFYKGMEKQRFGIDSLPLEYMYVATLALSDVAESEIENINRKYELLSTKLPKEIGVKTIAQILAIGGKLDNEAVHRVFALNEAFKARKMWMNRKYTLPLLGILALVPDNVVSIVQDVREAYVFIRMRKEFGGISSEEQLIYAAAIIASGYKEDVKEDLLIASACTHFADTLQNDHKSKGELYRFLFRYILPSAAFALLYLYFFHFR